MLVELLVASALGSTGGENLKLSPEVITRELQTGNGHTTTATTLETNPAILNWEDVVPSVPAPAEGIETEEEKIVVLPDVFKPTENSIEKPDGERVETSNAITVEAQGSALEPEARTNIYPLKVSTRHPQLKENEALDLRVTALIDGVKETQFAILLTEADREEGSLVFELYQWVGFEPGAKTLVFQLTEVDKDGEFVRWKGEVLGTFSMGLDLPHNGADGTSSDAAVPTGPEVPVPPIIEPPIIKPPIIVPPVTFVEPVTSEEPVALTRKDFYEELHKATWKPTTLPGSNPKALAEFELPQT